MAGDDPKPSALEEDADEEDPYINDLFDEFRGFTDEDIQNVMADFNPSLMDLSFTESTPPSMCVSLPTDVDQTQLMHELDLSITDYSTKDEFDGLSSFVDDGYTISWDMFEPSNDDPKGNINSDVPGEIRNDNGNDNVGETTRLEVSTRVFGDANGPHFETGGTSTMHVPIISDRMFETDDTFVCPCCIMLRELVHVKEEELMNTLMIYGGIGFLCHAVLRTQLLASHPMEPQPQPQPQPQIIHLKDLTMEDVKKFIEDYCSQRVASGLSLVQDTNAAFYQAMSVNSIFHQSPEPMLAIPTCSDIPVSLVLPHEALDVRPLPLHVGLREQATTGVPTEKKNRKKTPLAAQRERTKNMKLKDFRMHFHLPIEAAAKEMKVCPTVIKKICRDGGLMRWPHRKIRSRLTKIESLKRSLCMVKDGESKARAEAEIERLQRDIEKICSDALKNAK